MDRSNVHFFKAVRSAYMLLWTHNSNKLTTLVPMGAKATRDLILNNLIVAGQNRCCSYAITHDVLQRLRCGFIESRVST